MFRAGLASACFVALVSSFMIVSSASAAGWNVECEHTKFHAVDPITRMRSHVHDFFGTSPSLSSNYVTMRRSSTNCSRSEDTAGYWSPAMIRAEDGRAIAPEVVKLYYRSNMADKSSVRPAPANLRIIAGNAYAGTPQSTEIIAWDCVNKSSNKPYGFSSEPWSCISRRDQPRVSIVFPECWDGAHIDSWNHKDHMAYSSGGYCPATHPVPIPQLTMSIMYPSRATPAGRVNWENARIATMPGQPPGAERYSAHADFWNTWKQYGPGSMTYLTAYCIRKGVVCGAQ